MKTQKIGILGIAKNNMLLMAQKVAPFNAKVVTLDGNRDELKTRIKKTDAILLMSKDGGSNIAGLKKTDIEGKPVAVLKFPKKGELIAEQNMKEVIRALTKWARHLRKN